MPAHLDDNELYLWGTGANAYAYRALGCHEVVLGGKNTFRFAVWAPNARAVSVVGSFNGWEPQTSPMQPCGTSGVWEAHVSAARRGDTYKYAIYTPSGDILYKADPFAFYSEHRPNTASVVYDIGGYAWHDQEYLRERAEQDPHCAPMSVYEVHLGSWKMDLDYDEMADQLVRYVVDMGYTHIELMPVTEYPLDDSWGYQVTGYFSITSRYGTPKQFMHFIDACHRAGIGVILDWVPAHFPRDAHGLICFDGTPLYEPPDWRRAEQPQWGTLTFDYGRTQVQSFLISNAVFFLNEFHIDALRVDAVSSMLYLDYGRSSGQWLPNVYGGRENLDAIAFLRQLSDTVRRECPGALLIAEESTAFPGITLPVQEGGLGFDFKWNMGWMNDTLSYMEMDSFFRSYHHDKLTFPMYYAFSEAHVLPLSHDEMVHGKHSLLDRMPGSYEDKFRQLRLLMMYQYAHPGKKLQFMGSEFGQFIEWDFHRSLDWFLLDYPEHANLYRFMRALNQFYLETPALWEIDEDWDGFEWVSVNDYQSSVIAFIRSASDGSRVLCAFNFTSVTRQRYRLRLRWPVALRQAMSGVDFREVVVHPSFDDAGDYIDITLFPYEAVYYDILEEGWQQKPD